MAPKIDSDVWWCKSHLGVKRGVSYMLFFPHGELIWSRLPMQDLRVRGEPIWVSIRLQFPDSWTNSRSKLVSPHGTVPSCGVSSLLAMTEPSLMQQGEQ